MPGKKLAIESLSDEDVAALPLYREKWLNIGLSVEPIDQERAMASVCEAYRCAGMKEPTQFVFLASPYEGAVAATLLAQVRDQVWPEVRAKVWAEVQAEVGADVGDKVRAKVRDQVRDQVGANVWDQVGAKVWEQVGAKVRDQIRDQVWEQVWSQVRDNVWAKVGADVGDKVRAKVGADVGDKVRGQVWKCGYGNHDAGWLSFYDYFSDRGLAQQARGLIATGAECGWWWPFEDACIITDRPEVLRRDEQNRLHSETGPSIRYRDGWSLYHWHGVSVPAHWIEDRENLDVAEVLRTENVEQRAAGAAIIGWAKIADRLDRRIIDGDPETDMGALVELTLPGLPEPGRFLMARCPRNGTICEGVPRVSDIDGLPINTVIAAQAWRVGDPASEYAHPPKRT